MSVAVLADTQSRPFVAKPITDDEAGAMVRAVVSLFKRWELTDEQAATLLDLPRRTCARWKAGKPGRMAVTPTLACPTSWGSTRR